MSTLRNSTLLYRPSLKVWEARKLDKSESAKVNKENGAVDGAANVHKQLLPDSKELEAIQKWRNSFRTFIYTSTLPWDDSGWRIGRVDRHMDFMGEIGDRIVEGDALVDAFVHAYELEIEKAKGTLGHLFNHSDYPTSREVRHKFLFTVDVQPIPSAGDFRDVGGVPKDEVDRLVKIATDMEQQKIQDAMREAYERLYTVVAKMANTLEQYGNKTVKKFNDSLVDNIGEIIAVMPALNLTGDPKLAALADDAKQLAMYSAMDLRQDEKVRNAAITEARTLAAKFKGHIAASIADDHTPVQPPVIKPVKLSIVTPDNTPVNTPVNTASAPKRAMFADML
jgi:hypothetical protein